MVLVGTRSKRIAGVVVRAARNIGNKALTITRKNTVKDVESPLKS